MKIIILGGAGGMGSGAAQLLLHYPKIEKITLADIDLEKVETMRQEIDSTIIDTQVIDVRDHDALVNVLKDYDVVLNTVGPYVHFAIPILKASMEAQIDYVDVCDDHDATEMLLEMDDEVKKSGITALIGMGTTPGISNMQAKLVAEKLDNIENLKISWAVGTPPYKQVKGTPMEGISNLSGKEMLTKASWEHMVHVSTGDIPIWKNGQWDRMPALEHGEYIDFAEPLGRVESYYLGHSEPITLPRYFKINNFSACLGALRPDISKELRKEARGHSEALETPVIPKTKQWEAPKEWEERGVWAGQAAIAEGMQDGQKIRYTARFMMATQDALAYNNAGQAIGTYQMGAGAISSKGVVTPEETFAVDPFFEELTRIYNANSGDNFTVEELILVEKEFME